MRNPGSGSDRKAPSDSGPLAADYSSGSTTCGWRIRLRLACSDLIDRSIEQWLSNLEGQFETLRRDKIVRCDALTDEDKATLFIFVASAHFRTAANCDHLREQFGAAVEMGDRIQAHIESLSTEARDALEDFPRLATAQQLAKNHVNAVRG